MKKQENPTVQNLSVQFTNDPGNGQGGGSGGGHGQGTLNHPCPDCGGCFQSKEALARHRNTSPSNLLGGECPGLPEDVEVCKLLSQ